MTGIIGSGLELYLHQQAREKGLNRLAEAQEQAAKLAQEVAAQIEAKRREMETQIARLVEEKHKRAVAQARLRAKRTIIQQQEQVIQQVWEQVEAALKAQSDTKERLSTLAHLLADAAVQLRGGPLEVQANATDRALLDGGALAEIARQLWARYNVTGLTLAEDPVPISGGVIVRRLDKNEIVDNSFEERLALERRTLRNDVYRLLDAKE